MKKAMFLFLLAFLPFSVIAQTVISDVGYYRFEASSFGRTEQEAVQNAVNDAAEKIFASIHKDSLFTEMFLSSWPEAVIVETKSTAPSENGYEATVSVKIDRNAVLLAEPNYRNAVQTRLNEAERSIVKIEGLLATAASSEENGDTEKAGILYSQANDSLNELIAITGVIQDKSVLSSEGNSIEYVRSRIKGFDATIESGLNRLKIVRNKEEEKIQTGEALSTYGPLKSSLNRLERDYTTLSDKSPFFGLTEEELEEAISKCDAAIRTLNTQLLPKYSSLKASLDDNMQSLESKVDLDINRIETLSVRFNELKSLAEKELNEPKSKRVEAQQKRSENSKQLKDRLMWTLLHPPRDRLVIRITPDIGFSGSEVETPGFGIGLTAEKAFESGVWGRAQLMYTSDQSLRQDSTFASAMAGSTSDRKDVLFSQLAIGFHTHTLYGIGLGWQWDNSYADPELYGGDSPQQEPMFYPAVFWGKVDKERNWPTFLAEYSYGIPSSMDLTDPLVFINGRIKLILRGDDYLLVEAEGWSMPANRMLPYETSYSEHLYISQGIRLGAGIRIPGPFTWGVSFTGTRNALYVSDELQDFSAMKWIWGMFFQYSI